MPRTASAGSPAVIAAVAAVRSAAVADGVTRYSISWSVGPSGTIAARSAGAIQAWTPPAC